jgi:hypothetical protein
MSSLQFNISQMTTANEGDRKSTEGGGIKMKKFKMKGSCSSIFFLLTVCAGFVLLIMPAIAADKGEKTSNATLKVCPTAKITTLECFMKKSKFSGGEKLHVKIAIKNISDKPHRYRVSIFLPDGASSGGFYPRKGKPPVLKPGEEKERTFPMYFDSIPTDYTVKVDEI